MIEVIKLLGTVSKDENCGELLYEHGTIEQVINLLKSKMKIIIIQLKTIVWNRKMAYVYDVNSYSS